MRIFISRTSTSLSCLVVESDGGCYTTMPPTAMRLDSPPCNNNNNSASGAELALLAKLEEANRIFESDAKSLNSLSGASASGHSRKSSDTSQISLTSGTSIKKNKSKRYKIINTHFCFVIKEQVRKKKRKMAKIYGRCGVV